MRGKAFYLVASLAVLGASLGGCNGGSETSVTKQQEDAFRNPPKEIPPESLKAMQKAREEGARMAEEARRKSSSGG
ncbi:hypothetical protein EON79_02030 [bacterium]|nr:MAG: hypothetical protein EON79_02030 [bacterium]